MPPKASSSAGGPFSLTTKETQMLTAVVTLMGDVPEIDFDKLAAMVGQKYARNARSACKKLFERIRASTPAGLNNAPTNEGMPEEDEEGAATKTSKSKKDTATKSEIKLGVGPRAAPRKAAGDAKRKGTATKGSKVSHNEEISFAQVDFEQDNIVDENADIDEA